MSHSSNGQHGSKPKLLPTITSSTDLALKVFPEPRWAVKGIIPEGLTLLAGAPKLGKTFLMLGTGIAVASGGYALGNIQVESGEVLYLSLEDNERRMQKRQALLLGAATGVPGLHFAYTWPRLDMGGVDMLRQWLTEHPAARLVVIDTLKKVRPRRRPNSNLYEEDYDAISPLHDLASNRGMAIVVTHHTRKAEAEDVLDKVSGSQGLAAASDTVIVLQRERGQHDATLFVTGRDIEDDGEIALSYRQGLWTQLGKAADYRKSTERQAVIKCLKANNRPMKPLEVANENGTKPANTKKIMSVMGKSGDIKAEGDGFYTHIGYTGYPVTAQGDHGNHGNHSEQSNHSNQLLTLCD